MNWIGKFIMGFIGLAAFGYGVGVFVAKQQSDQYWTEGKVRQYIISNHKTSPSPQEKVLFKCNDDVYAFNSLDEKLVALGTNSALWIQLPHLTSAQAFIVAGFFGVTGYSGLKNMTQNWNAALTFAATALGFGVGYGRTIEVVPKCRRESVQAALKDLDFWKELSAKIEKVNVNEGFPIKGVTVNKNQFPIKQ